MRIRNFATCNHEARTNHIVLNYERSYFRGSSFDPEIPRRNQGEERKVPRGRKKIKRQWVAAAGSDNRIMRPDFFFSPPLPCVCQS